MSEWETSVNEKERDWLRISKRKKDKELGIKSERGRERDRERKIAK